MLNRRGMEEGEGPVNGFARIVDSTKYLVGVKIKILKRCKK